VKLEKAHILHRLLAHMEIAIETESSIGKHCESQRALAMSIALQVRVESEDEPSRRLRTGTQ